MKTRSQPYRLQKKQARLAFEPIPSSSPAKNVYSAAVQGRLAGVRYEGSKARSTHLTRSTSRNEDTLPTPEPSSQPQIHRSSSPESERSPQTPNFRSKSATNKHNSDTAEEDEEDEEIILPSSKRRRINANSDINTPTRDSARLRSLRTPQSNSLSTRQSGRVARHAPSSPIRKALSIGSAETSGDEEDVIVSRPTSKPRRRTQPVADDDPFVISDDADVPVKNARRKSSSAINGAQSRSKEQDFVVGDDEVEYISSDENADGSAARRRKSPSKKKRHRSRQKQNEIEDDLKDLQDSENAQSTEMGRTRGGPVTTQRDRNREHLEILKQRRAGGRRPRVVNSDSEDDQFDEEDEADLDDIVQSNPVRGVTISEDSQSETADEAPGLQEAADVNEEDDFIVDDESQAFRNHHSGIPLAFTSFASRKPRELFVYLIEWLIKNKIAPAFNRDDELYQLSWNKVNDQINAQAGSRLISSAWNEDFKNTILARPQMKVHLVSEGDDEFFLNCDACNKTNHPARYEFKFDGHAYHKDTLEPVDEEADVSNDEDEDESDNDKASYDYQGHLLPSIRTTFNLGRFCAANAEMGHKLTHWKYHLNESLLAYLEEQGVLSAEAILAREKLSKKKREREAENIVDQMQETRVIEELWRGLQDDLEDARFGMEDHYAKGGRRNHNRIGKVRVNRGDGRIEEWSEGGRLKMVVPSDSE